MKSLITALSALALSFALTTSAAAQQTGVSAEAAQPTANPAQTTAPANPSAQASAPQTPIPLAEAKQRYRAAQERLRTLAEGGSAKLSEPPLALFVASQKPRDRLRTAVAEDFDARRQLQQAELAELEARVARIKRALEIRDAMRETLIDERTDELLEQMEEGGQKNQSGVEDSPRTVPGADQAAPPRTIGAKQQERLLQLDADEAKSILEAAEKDYNRARRFFDTGSVDQATLDEHAVKCKRAQLQLERAKLKLDAFREQHRDLPEAKASAKSVANDGTANPPASEDSGAIERQSRLRQLDADEAIANFESADRAYRRLEKLRASGAVEQDVIDEQIEALAVARIHLERAAMEAALEVEEAEANLDSAERAVKRAEKLHATGAIEQSVLDQELDEYNLAKIQLDRAESNLDMFDREGKALEVPDRSPAGEAVNGPNKASLAQREDMGRPIIWGPKGIDVSPDHEVESNRLLQLGLSIEPKKAAYAPGDVVTASLFLSYRGKVPHGDIWEALGIDLVLRDTDQKLEWKRGPAHKELARLGHDSAALAESGVMPLRPMKIAIGSAETVRKTNHDPMVLAYLDIKPGQAAQLLFKLTGGPAKDGVSMLTTAPLDIRVEEPAQESPAGRATPNKSRLPDLPEAKKPAVDDGAPDASREAPPNANRIAPVFPPRAEGDDPILVPTRNNTVLSAFDKSRVDLDQIVWGPKDEDILPAGEGKPAGALQLGLDMEPKKPAYTPGDVLTARLFLKYTGKQEAVVVIPAKMTERIGIDLDAPDRGEKHVWRWGPAYKKPARSANNSAMRFKPGGMQQFPNLRLVVGTAATPADAENDLPIFAYLDAKPGQTIRLRFKLTSDVLQLATEPIDLRVQEPAKEPRAGDEAVAKEKPN